MDMIGYLGKKVDLVCTDGKKYSGYVYDVVDADDSDIGAECIELSPLDELFVMVIPSEEIEIITIDDRYKDFDFRS